MNRAPRQYWTRHDEKVLAIVYSTSTKEQLEEMFNKSSELIYQKAFALGLKKDSRVISSQMKIAMRNKKRKEK